MVFHELGDDLVLLNEFGPKVLDFAVLDLLDARRPSWPVLERFLCLVEDELDPIVDLAGLEAELIGEVGNELLAAEMASDDLGFLVWSEVSAGLLHRMPLPSGSFLTQPPNRPPPR